ncbi:hypothetical protein FACS189416_3740 [Bacteroidia bacterium]|nr:hypothetical protein FACS189416_3740 [Bacteroidia bacterium]
MNILMVGHSKAGKTTFMAGMYRYLGNSNDGYGITLYDTERKKQLEIIANDLSNGIYPKGTDVQKEYDFYLTVNGDPIIPFNWTDYRGGALMSEDEGDDEVIDLMRKIENADALIIFLNGTKLANHRPEYEIEYDILKTCIESAIGSKEGVIFPISFVVTKYDLCDDCSTGLSYFYDLFEEISKSTFVEGILTWTIVNKDSYFTPFIPLMYSLWRGSNIYIKKRLEYYQSLLQKRRGYNPSLVEDGVQSIFKGIGNFLGEDWSWKTESQKANDCDSDIYNEINHLQYLDSMQEDMEEKVKKFITDELIRIF